MTWKNNKTRIEQTRQEIQRKIAQINMERRELSLPHNPYTQEERECLSIENGDKEGLQRALAKNALVQ